MKTAARVTQHGRRFDLRMAAACLENNGKVVAEVLADERATIPQRREAKELLRLTELSLMGAIGAYLKEL